MKIIKNNMTDPIRCQCKDCGSLFEFDYKDIQRREDTIIFLGVMTSKRFVVCPVCEYENNFEDIKKDIWEVQNCDLSKDDYSRTLSSQFLSKQHMDLIERNEGEVE